MKSEREQIAKIDRRLEFWRRLCGYFRRGTPGIWFIDYLMIAGLASLGAIAGSQHLNGARHSAVEEQAHIVRDIPDRAPPSGLISDPGLGRPGTPGIPGGVGIVPRPDGRPGLPVIQPFQCFGAGTLVAAEHGNRPIEALVAGDLVWSRDVA